MIRRRRARLSHVRGLYACVFCVHAAACLASRCLPSLRQAALSFLSLCQPATIQQFKERLQARRLARLGRPSCFPFSNLPHTLGSCCCR